MSADSVRFDERYWALPIQNKSQRSAAAHTRKKLLLSLEPSITELTWEPRQGDLPLV